MKNFQKGGKKKKRKEKEKKGEHCNPTHIKHEAISNLHICRTDRMSETALRQLKTVGGLPGENQVLF